MICATVYIYLLHRAIAPCDVGEPKIKFYFSVNSPLDLKENAPIVEKALDAKIQKIIKEMKLN